MLTLPSDITREEVLLLEIVKLRMLSKLTKTQQIIFLMLYELDYNQCDVAEVLGVTEGAITHQKYKIRTKLGDFKK